MWRIVPPRLGAALFLILPSTNAIASSSQLGHVSAVIVNHSGIFFFKHDGQRDAKPGCAVFHRWVVDATTPAGQAMMALILTAQTQGKLIAIVGNGDCSDWPDTEAIAYVQTAN